MAFEAINLIEQAIKRHGNNIGVACSFGKDSNAVLHMALQIKPDIPVIFENTGVEFPETIRHKNRLKEEWKLNLYETKPLKTFWECAKEYGLPTVRKQSGKGRNSPLCCQYLKEKPGLKLQRELGITAIITGLQACESRARFLVASKYDNGNAPYMEHDNIQFCSQRWFTRSTNMWSFHPIMLWSTAEVWEYTEANNIPVNEVYTKWGGLYERCGCLPCTAYISWKEKLPISHPKLYRKLVEMSGQGQLPMIG